MLTPTEEAEIAELRLFKRDAMKLLVGMTVRFGECNADGTLSAAVPDPVLARIDSEIGWLFFDHDRSAGLRRLTYHSAIRRLAAQKNFAG
jgi:hypothetical protein